MVPEVPPRMTGCPANRWATGNRALYSQTCPRRKSTSRQKTCWRGGSPLSIAQTCLVQCPTKVHFGFGKWLCFSHVASGSSTATTVIAW
eukprot:6482940-Amphidinium_carterae.1